LNQIFPRNALKLMSYVNSKTIQKGLFDLTIFINKTDVDKTNLLLKDQNLEDYYGAVAMTGIQSDRLADFIKGKR